MNIPITRNFDPNDPIGYLTLRDDVDIPPGSVFALSYTVLAGTPANPTKIQVNQVSLIPVPLSANYAQKHKNEKENHKEEDV